MVPMLREGGSPFPCDLSLLSGSCAAPPGGGNKKTDASNTSVSAPAGRKKADV